MYRNNHHRYIYILYLQCNKKQEHQLVPFKQPPASIHEHGECDIVEQVPDANFQIIRRLGVCERVFKHDAVRLQRELVHRVDLVDFIEDEVEKGSPGGGSSEMGFLQLKLSNIAYYKPKQLTKTKTSTAQSCSMTGNDEPEL